MRIMTEENKRLWDRCAAFHGHVCPGLTMGFKAALLAVQLLDLHFSSDEQVVCIAENDACSVDAIQVILGCTVGKGNLLFHITGKQAYSVYNRKTGTSVRLVLRPIPEGMSREETMDYLHNREPEELFDVKPVKLQVPEHARLFSSCRCDRCGEETGTNWIRLSGGRKLCLDCYEQYDRFHI